MRKFIAALALGLLLSTGGCRTVYGTLWKGPKWVADKAFNQYTGNPGWDGEVRWDNFTSHMQRIQNVVNIHLLNFDMRDPFLGAPFFGDPR